jgi:hypothetical protein
MPIRIKTPEFEGDIKTLNYDNDGAFCVVTKIVKTDRFIDRENPIIYLDTKTMIESELSRIL